jgi:hypothetical protein
MRGRICCGLIWFLLLPAHSQADPACVDPALLDHSTIGITRYFDPAEPNPEPGVVGVRGTGWFLSPSTIVTAEHVASGMLLSTQDWKMLDIQDGAENRKIPARIQRVAGHHAEKLATIELQAPFSSARSVAIRTAPLAPDDPVVAVTYMKRELREVGGRFVRYGDDTKFAGTALLEMFDGNNRLAIDHGASGAPVLDCEGHVAAVVTTVITQVFSLLGETRISTPWGTPNVVSLPIQTLNDLSQAR